MWKPFCLFNSSSSVIYRYILLLDEIKFFFSSFFKSWESACAVLGACHRCGSERVKGRQRDCPISALLESRGLCVCVCFSFWPHTLLWDTTRSPRNLLFPFRGARSLFNFAGTSLRLINRGDSFIFSSSSWRQRSAACCGSDQRRAARSPAGRREHTVGKHERCRSTTPGVWTAALFVEKNTRTTWVSFRRGIQLRARVCVCLCWEVAREPRCGDPRTRVSVAECHRVRPWSGRMSKWPPPPLQRGFLGRADHTEHNYCY